MLRYFIFIEYGLLPDLRVGVLISASQSKIMAQQNGIEKPDLHALPTISDRMTFIYLGHCKVSRENGAVTATDLDGTVYIPAAAITVLLLGPGTLFPAYAGVIL